VQIIHDLCYSPGRAESWVLLHRRLCEWLQMLCDELGDTLVPCHVPPEAHCITLGAALPTLLAGRGALRYAFTHAPRAAAQQQQQQLQQLQSPRGDEMDVEQPQQPQQPRPEQDAGAAGAVAAAEVARAPGGGDDAGRAGEDGRMDIVDEHRDAGEQEAIDGSNGSNGSSSSSSSGSSSSSSSSSSSDVPANAATAVDGWTAAFGSARAFVPAAQAAASLKRDAPRVDVRGTRALPPGTVRHTTSPQLPNHAQHRKTEPLT